jgi:hypothetical protein
MHPWTVSALVEPSRERRSQLIELFLLLAEAAARARGRRRPAVARFAGRALANLWSWTAVRRALLAEGCAGVATKFARTAFLSGHKPSRQTAATLLCSVCAALGQTADPTRTQPAKGGDAERGTLAHWRRDAALCVDACEELLFDRADELDPLSAARGAAALGTLLTFPWLREAVVEDRRTALVRMLGALDAFSGTDPPGGEDLRADETAAASLAEAATAVRRSLATSDAGGGA